MDPLFQVCRWIQGESLHDPVMNRHVPDYSCCRPELLAHREERELFLWYYMLGDVPAVERVLLMFMGRMLRGIRGRRTPPSQ